MKINYDKNKESFLLENVIAADCITWENLVNKDMLFEQYMYLNKCNQSDVTGLYQLVLNGCTLWLGTLEEINAIVKSMIICAEKNNFIEN